MRIIVLANRDIASNLAINYLHNALPEHQLSVFLSAQVGNNANKPQPLSQLAFFEQNLFNDILFPALQGRALSPSTSLKSFDELNMSGISVKPIESVSSQQGLDTLAITKPHLILSIRFGLILQPSAISIPEFGVLNLHSGILPDYRGVMATFWAMLNGEKEIGTSLHFIQDEGIDTGDVISIQKSAVNYQRSYLWNVLNLYQAGVHNMANVVEQIAQGKSVQGTAQSPDQGKYYSFPDNQAFKAFVDKGLRLYCQEEIVSIAQGYM